MDQERLKALYSEIAEGSPLLQNGAVTIGEGGTSAKSAAEALQRLGAAAQGHTHSAAEVGAATETHAHACATSTANGFESAADKAKLDGIATGANKYEHPATHSASSITGLHLVATNGDYNDLKNRPESLPANGGNADTVDGFSFVNTAVSGTPIFMPGWAGGGTPADMKMYAPENFSVNSAKSAMTLSQTLPVALGGTGATTAADARTALGTAQSAAALKATLLWSGSLLSTATLTLSQTIDNFEFIVLETANNIGQLTYANLYRVPQLNNTSSVAAICNAWGSFICYYLDFTSNVCHITHVPEDVGDWAIKTIYGLRLP